MNKILAIAALALGISAPDVFAENNQEQIVTEQSCGSGSMWLPPGSNVVSDDAGALEIQAPADWLYVGRNNEGEVSPMADVSCSCACNTTGSCSPSVFDGKCSCTVKGDCTSCSLIASGSPAVLTQQGEIETAGPEADISKGGFVDLKVGVRFATAEDGDLPMVFSEMFELAPITAALESFFVESGLGKFGAPKVVQDGDGFMAPEGFQLAKVNVFGRAALILVPSPWNDGPTEIVVPGGRGSCSCTAPRSCVHANNSAPALEYCDGPCNACSMILSPVTSLSSMSRDGH